MPGTKRKRGNGYYLEVCLGQDYNGKYRRFSKTVHVKSDREADKELAKFYAECEAGHAPKPSTLTIKALCELYLKEEAPYSLRQSSIAGITSNINIHIIPELGTTKAVRLTTGGVQRWVNQLKRTLSPKTVRNLVTSLSTVYAWALKEEKVSKNPCRGIAYPTPTHTEARYLKEPEVLLLLDRLEMVSKDDLKYKAAIYIALFGGLRKSEILGLNREDFNSTLNTLKIGRTRQVGAKIGVYEDTTKTEKSQRVATVPVEISQMLKDMTKLQDESAALLGTEWRGSPALFLGQFGQSLYPMALPKWFDKFQDTQGLHKINLHGLRHTHASMLIHMDKDKMQISRRLGHAKLSTTLDVYAHLFVEENTIAEDLSKEFDLKNRFYVNFTSKQDIKEKNH